MRDGMEDSGMALAPALDPRRTVLKISLDQLQFDRLAMFQ
jgi:hypothetical protein